MDLQTLTEIGFTTPQAKAYITLIKSGPITPPELAQKISESRSNTYKILDRLVEMGVVSKAKVGKKLMFRPENPIALENSIRQTRNQILEREQHIKATMPTLLSYFYTFSDQPGIRFFKGKDEVKEVFNDMLRTGKSIYLIRSPADVEFYNEKFFEAFRKKRAQRGITTHALTPDVPSAVHDPQVDSANKFIRTWIPKDAYTAAVEWNIYGDKIAVISYGEEAVATIIESPQIAASFRQLFALMAKSGNS